jgi:putative ABC transport system permease protein
MNMKNWHLGPIVAAMRRNKVGALLISTQMAVTLAFMVNALTLIEQRISWSARPSGVDESRLFVVELDPLAQHVTDGSARVEADLAKLRSIDGVKDVSITNDYPFSGGGWSQSINLQPNQKSSSAITSTYFADTHSLATWGLKLVVGRNFTADEVVNRDGESSKIAGSVIITQALAHSLFPSKSPLGQLVYIENDTDPARIVGVVDRMQGPFPASTGRTSTFSENSSILPYKDVSGFGTYVVRVDPEQMGNAMRGAEAGLLELDRDRSIRSISLTDARAKAHRGDHGLVVLLVSICMALLIVTAFGIIGLTSYWVSQRRQQIGIRRALGATRHDIVQYFQTENLIISAVGVSCGIAFAIALNIWMVRGFEMTRLNNSRAIVGAVIVLALGQLAVFWPALRASLVPPALATRGG